MNKHQFELAFESEIGSRAIPVTPERFRLFHGDQPLPENPRLPLGAALAAARKDGVSTLHVSDAASKLFSAICARKDATITEAQHAFAKELEGITTGAEAAKLFAAGCVSMGRNLLAGEAPAVTR